MLLSVFFVVGFGTSIAQPDSSLDLMTRAATSVHIGSHMVLAMNNNGVLGTFSDSRIGVDSTGLDYPLGSGIVHLRGAGLWIGAVVRTGGRKSYRVSTAYLVQPGVGYFGEFLGFNEEGDSIWRASTNEIGIANRRGFDDDGDGRIDEDELDGADNDGDWLINRDDLNNNGKPDHGEPNVDEDYGAVSEQDVYFAYRDSFKTFHVPGHIPLCVRVWQKAYSWEKGLTEPIIPIEYTIVNQGLQALDSVYVGFFTDPILTIFGNPPGTQIVGYFPDLRTAYAQGVSQPVTPFGITLLGSSKAIGDLRLTYRSWDNSTVYPQSDADRFIAMSSGVIDGEKSRNGLLANVLSVGPFEHMATNDTVRFSIAILAGQNLDAGASTIRDHAARAIELYNRGFQPPVVPPSPPLRLRADSSGIRLDWSWDPSSPRSNPEEAWDDSNRIVSTLPDTHWRRQNPPAGKSGGGRIFEAYRIWRSEYPVFDETQFSLIRQFDVRDDLDLEGQTGIVHAYVDSSVVRGRRYWYAVTSRSVPDYFLVPRMSTSGQVVGMDTILTEPTDSPLFQNAITSAVPFTPSTEVGRVKVVPNPYRTDRNYIYEQGGWEGLGRLWTENRRVVWFIHLPPKCTIRIFSLAGEVIKTIAHDDDNRQSRNVAVGQEEFELLSESNRVLASGIYLYLVDSDYGRQMGKFVVIR
jgi:hypothetical protein